MSRLIYPDQQRIRRLLPKLFIMNKITFLKSAIFTMVLFSSITLSAQSAAEIATVSKNAVIQAAPNLPKMERSTKEGLLFHGVKFTYKAKENEKALKDWSVNFPREVVDYKIAIAKYLEDTAVSNLSAADQDAFYDLKNQWIMSLQVIN